MTKVIVFSGKKQSGKDSSADYVAERLREIGKTVKMLAFADPLKKFCIDVLGLTHDQCYGADEQKNSLTSWKWDNIDLNIRIKYSIKTNELPPARALDDVLPLKIKVSRTGYMTAREVMAIFGTDIMREMFNEDVWALGALNTINSMDVDYVLITDARFPNEIDVARDKDILTIRLHRLNYPNTDTHPSETSLDDYPHKNYSYYVEAESLDVLFNAIDNIMIKEKIYEKN